MGDGVDFASAESSEVSFLKACIEDIKGEAMLRALLFKIVSLPRQNVFGAVVIQSGALRRAITGEALTEAQHTQMPSDTRMYAVTFKSSAKGRPITRNVLARDEEEALHKTRRHLQENRQRCVEISAMPLINERGFAHNNPTKKE